MAPNITFRRAKVIRQSLLESCHFALLEKCHFASVSAMEHIALNANPEQLRKAFLPAYRQFATILSSHLDREVNPDNLCRLEYKAQPWNGIIKISAMEYLPNRENPEACQEIEILLYRRRDALFQLRAIEKHQLHSYWTKI